MLMLMLWSSRKLGENWQYEQEVVKEGKNREPAKQTTLRKGPTVINTMERVCLQVCSYLASSFFCASISFLNPLIIPTGWTKVAVEVLPNASTTLCSLLLSWPKLLYYSLRKTGILQASFRVLHILLKYRLLFALIEKVENCREHRDKQTLGGKGLIMTQKEEHTGCQCVKKKRM